jgi:glycosyltransferase involved in cell wall biosynthesis
MSEPLDALGLYYDEGSYVEPGMVQGGVPSGGPPGMMGRQVACKGFLDAYLDAGEAGRLVAILARPSGREPLRKALEAHPSPRGRQRRIEVVPESNFHATFFPDPPATVVHFPSVPDARYAWTRQAGGPDTFAISGVALAQASLHGVEALRNLVTAPFEPYDRVICPSRAVMAMIRAVTDAYAGHLRERSGGHPGLRVPLEHIPHGVDPDRFRPATGEERLASRHRLGVDDDEICVLSVGRLSLHAKANPFPLFDGVARAARASGRKAHLVLAGWAANEGIHRAFQDGARVFAAGVRTTLVNGTDPEYRRSAWHAADAFALLADSLQETSGLAIAEAMASGLPVVASDWDGCRENVAHGETGFLVPTAMVRGAGAGATSRLLLGEIGYDAFLGECSQAAAVDPFAAAEAFAALFADEGLRRRMGEAGRRRALEHLTWGTAVRAHDRVWRDQEAERAERRAHRDREGGGRAARTGPACYPPPDEAFAAFPTALLGEDARAVADEDARERLDWLLRMTMSNYGNSRRSADPAALAAALAAARAPARLADLAGALADAGVPAAATRPTLAWMLKYGLIRAEAPPGHEPNHQSPRDLAP